MATKKVTKVKKSGVKRLWAVINSMDGVSKLEDFYYNVDDVQFHVSEKLALEDFEPNNNDYIVEFTIKSIRTDKVDQNTKLHEVKLK